MVQCAWPMLLYFRDIFGIFLRKRRNHRFSLKKNPLFIENIVEIAAFICYYNIITIVYLEFGGSGGGEQMEIDIANNIKAVELLKIEILQNVTDLFGDIAAEADSETRERITGDAARLIAQTYLLCSRLGVDFLDVEGDMKAMLKDGIAHRHILERRFGDLRALLGHLESGREYYEKYEG